jgi:glycosyltransferase involved in cell wall biosynthesis
LEFIDDGDQRRLRESQSPASSNSVRRRRVLVIDEDLPWPTNSGKKIRTFALLRRLAKDYHVTLLCYGRDPEAIAALQAASIKVQTVAPLPERRGIGLYLALLMNVVSRLPYSVVKHYSEDFQRRFEELTSGDCYDLVQCEWTPYAQFLRRKIAPPVILSTHNIEAQIWERRADASSSLSARLFFSMQAGKMERFERWAFRHFGNVAVVSGADEEVAKRWGARDVWVVDNGVDLNQFTVRSHDEETPFRMLFLGSLDWFPNRDGLTWFASEVLPEIRRIEPRAVLRVVGRQAPPDLERQLRQTNGIDFVGEVEDVQQELANACIVVVPLRIGGGTRIKILEAMASGRAVVSTSIGAEGLEVHNKVHIRIADHSSDLAQTTASLLRDSDTRYAMTAAARALVANRYSWDRSARVLQNAWSTLLSRTPVFKS